MELKCFEFNFQNCPTLKWHDRARDGWEAGEEDGNSARHQVHPGHREQWQQQRHHPEQRHHHLQGRPPVWGRHPSQPGSARDHGQRVADDPHHHQGQIQQVGHHFSPVRFERGLIWLVGLFPSSELFSRAVRKFATLWVIYTGQNFQFLPSKQTVHPGCSFLVDCRRYFLLKLSYISYIDILNCIIVIIATMRKLCKR